MRVIIHEDIQQTADMYTAHRRMREIAGSNQEFRTTEVKDGLGEPDHYVVRDDEYGRNWTFHPDDVTVVSLD